MFDISKIKPIKPIQKKQKPAVVMFSLEGKPIKVFTTTYEAVDYILNNKLSKAKVRAIEVAILAACKLLSKTSFGYQWRFYKDVIKEQNNENK